MSIDPVPFHSGKVRDLFEAGDELILVASDRVSAFDVVLPTPIPDKGRVLTQLSAWWFARSSGIMANHLLSAELDEFPVPWPQHGRAHDWRDRALLCRRTSVLPVECVVRGFLAGSGAREYADSGRICGQKLPPGLREGDVLPNALFTPTTKAHTGHDQPLTWEETIDILGRERAEQVRELSLALYEFAAATARERGLLLADTKFEFGLTPEGELLLIDEMATPDSSRYWEAATHEPGRSGASFDKQFVRDFLDGLDWPKTPPGPPLPPAIVAGTRARYIEAFERLTGQSWRDRTPPPSSSA